MSELTRRQIEELRDFFSAYPEGETINALCDMALAWLEVQPGPIAKAKTKTHYLVRAGKNELWEVAYFDPVRGAWYESNTGHRVLRSERLKQFVDLSSLPEPK